MHHGGVKSRTTVGEKEQVAQNREELVPEVEGRYSDWIHMPCHTHAYHETLYHDL